MMNTIKSIIRSVSTTDEDDDLLEDSFETATKATLVALPSASVPPTGLSKKPQRRFPGDYRIVWLHSNTNGSNELLHPALNDELRDMYHKMDLFYDCDQSIDFLTEISCEKTYLIISNVVDHSIIPLIHDIRRLKSIYIVDSQKSADEQWMGNWPKVAGIFSQLNPIVDLIRQDTKHDDANTVSISIVSSNVQLSENLDQLDHSFMYTQIMKEIFLEIEYDEQSIHHLSQYYRSQCADNPLTLDNIDKFEKNYLKHPAIWWYTSTYFVYSMLNRALRTLEINALIQMGRFIHDLHFHIKELHSEQIHNHLPNIFTVYRGQCLSKTDFEKIRNSSGGLLSFNNFLSTSDDREVPLSFADSASMGSSDLIGVLFKLNIDRSITSTPFAFVNGFSRFEEEHEILFSMHAVFRIGEVKSMNDNDRLWEICLTMTSDDDQELKVITKELRKETVGLTGWHRLVPLLIRLGEFKKAEEMCMILLETPRSNSRREAIYHQLGYIYDRQSQFALAIEMYEKSLGMIDKTNPLYRHTLATTYNNIGLTYQNMDEHSKALSFFEKSRKIYEEIFSSNHPHLAVLYNNLGKVYEKNQEWKKALFFYEKSVSIGVSLRPNHPDLANAYKDIGDLYAKINDRSKALQFFEKAVQIEQRILPANHPSLAISYNHLGGIYMKLGDYPKSLSFYEKALEISQKPEYTCYDELAALHSNMGVLYEKLGDYTKAISCQEKSINTLRETSLNDCEQLAQSYDNIGLAYYRQNDLPKAVSFCEKALAIREKLSSSSSLDLASSYNNVGDIYMTMEKYTEALSLFEKSIEIQEKYRPSDHPGLANAYRNIASLYLKIGKTSNALTYAEKSHAIYLRTLPLNHPDLGGSYHSMANIYFTMDEISKALAAEERAVDIFQCSLPENHPHLENAQDNLQALKMLQNIFK